MTTKISNRCMDLCEKNRQNFDVAWSIVPGPIARFLKQNVASVVEFEHTQADSTSVGFYPEIIQVGQTYFFDKCCKTTRTVAALAHLRTIGVEYTIPECSVFPGRRFNQQ